MKPFETNGYHDVGVLNPTSPEDDFSGLKHVDVEGSDKQDEEEKGERARRKRRKLTGGLVVLGMLALVIGLFFWMTTGGKKRINLPVRDRNAQTDQATARNADDVTAQAIAEIRAAASPAPASSPAPSAGITPNVSSAPVTIPLGGTVTTVEAAPATNVGQTAGTSSPPQSKPAGIVSERNPERSIRCAQVPKPIAAASNPTTAAAPAAQIARSLPAVFLPNVEKPVALPSFGAMLPVRSLGAIYTLRQSLTRFELTRDIAGSGWSLKKGTALIGNMQGSQYDRAYITLLGFIDPDSGRLVKLAGDVLGADGAPGLQGKRRQISSRWSRVLNRVANNAVTLGQAALTRGNGVNVYLPNAAGSEIGFSSSALTQREFLEIPAGASAYILITDLPKEAKGVDPQPIAAGNAGGNGGGENNGALTDTELAELLSTGSPEQIRAALPRMTPELRHIAEMVLKGGK